MCSGSTAPSQMATRSSDGECTGCFAARDGTRTSIRARRHRTRQTPLGDPLTSSAHGRSGSAGGRDRGCRRRAAAHLGGRARHRRARGLLGHTPQRRLLQPHVPGPRRPQRLGPPAPAAPGRPAHRPRHGPGVRRPAGLGGDERPGRPRRRPVPGTGGDRRRLLSHAARGRCVPQLGRRVHGAAARGRRRGRLRPRRHPRRPAGRGPGEHRAGGVGAPRALRGSPTPALAVPVGALPPPRAAPDRRPARPPRPHPTRSPPGVHRPRRLQPGQRHVRPGAPGAGRGRAGLGAFHAGRAACGHGPARRLLGRRRAPAVRLTGRPPARRQSRVPELIGAGGPLRADDGPGRRRTGVVRGVRHREARHHRGRRRGTPARPGRRSGPTTPGRSSDN